MAVIRVELLSAEQLPDQQPPAWRVTQQVTHDDGSTDTAQYIFPIDTIEWRCGEYGYDPVVDIDEVLDIVLLEPHVDPVDPEDDDHLFNASTVAKARNKHRAMFKAARKTIELLDSVPEPAIRGVTKPGARQTLREGSPLDPDFIAVKKEHVRQARVKNRADRQERLDRRAAGPARRSLTELRDQLLPGTTEPAPVRRPTPGPNVPGTDVVGPASPGG
jgi:hypothetical protein